MIFRDREEAGVLLAKDLTRYAEAKNTVVLGLPRGGVVTASAVAKNLHLPLDVTCPRKIGAPFNPEYAIGAVTETGVALLSGDVIEELGVSEEYLKEQVEAETYRAQQRLALFRRNRPPRDLKGKTVILVDDGIATGATMKAAIKSVKAEHAAKVVVAVPVAPPETKVAMEQLADEVVCLFTPSNFYAVGQFYNSFNQVEDDEVIALL